MPTARKSTTNRRKPQPVTVTYLLPDLSPRLRTLALAMAGGDHTRVEVLGPGRFTVIDPVPGTIPTP